MTAEQSLQLLKGVQSELENSGTSTNLVFAAKTPGDPPAFSIRHVQFHQRLVNDFKLISLRVLKEISDCTLLQYDPSYKLDSNEVMYLELQSSRSVKDLVDQASNIDDLDLMNDDPGFFEHMAFYGIFHRVGNHDLVMLRSVSAKNLLRRSRKLGIFFESPIYNRFEHEVVMLDREIDCLAFEGYLFISNMSGFHKLTQYHQEVVLTAANVIDTAAAIIPILNLEELKEIGMKDYRMAAKLASIKNKPYISTLTMERVREVIRQHNLPIVIKSDNGIDKLVFEKDPQKRFLILKVLDDDYLHSNMTDHNYAVNSKVQSAQ